jgi:hydroxymethylpyrimidine pyrophosphatase-like HAD family hydrolase
MCRLIVGQEKTNDPSFTLQLDRPLAMKRLVFVDLDDTLFQTRRKDPDASLPAALARDGSPLSFQSGKQSAFLEWLLTPGTSLVPVTGRNVAAFRRVLLPLGGYAICSFGGVILMPDGAPHPEWHARMAVASKTAGPTLARIALIVAAIVHRLDADCRQRIIEDADLPFYLSVKQNADDPEIMPRLAAECAMMLPPDWSLHQNGTNLAVLPPFLGKEKAVDYVLKTRLAGPAAMTVGIGDSLSDHGFMALCDYAVTPSKSQLFAGCRPALAGSEVAA